MKCQNCGKREATVKYYENINGLKKELHFCSKCAAELGIGHIQDIFSPMFINIPDYDIEEEVKCSNCGYTLDDYSKTGLFGCPKCYDTFNETLDELFLKLHGKNRHVNKNKKQKLNDSSKVLENFEEKKVEKLNRLDMLKEKLKKLVDEERYEEAAVIRDEIKKIENK